MARYMLHFAAIILFAFNASAADIDDKPHRKVFDKTLTVGFPYKYIEPLAIRRDDGRIVGLLPDLFTKYANQAGYNVEIQPFETFSDVMDAYIKGDLDAMIGVTATLERESIMTFSEPILAIRRGAVSKESLKTYKELKNKTVATIKGFADESFLRSILPSARALTVPSNLEAIRSVALGLADAQIGDGVMLYEHFKNSPYQDMVNMSIMDELPVDTLYLGVSKSDSQLLADLNEAIKVVNEQPEYTRTINRWLDEKQREFIRKATSLTLSKEEQKWIDNHPVVSIGISRNWAPIEEVVGGKYQGIAADVLDEVSHLTGIKFDTLSHRTHKETYQAFLKKESMMMSAISPTDERLKKMFISQGFMREPWVVVGLAKEYQTTLATFTLDGDDVLGVVDDTYGVSMAKELCSNCQVIGYETQYELISGVINGEIDAGVSSLLLAQPYMQGQYSGQLKVITNLNERSFIPVGFAIGKEHQMLLNIINKAISVIPPGRLEEIEKQWMRTSYQTGVKKNDVILWISIVMVAASLIVGAVFYSNRKLQGEIRQRQEAQEDLREAEVRARKAEQGIQYLADNVNGAVIQHFQNKDNLDDLEFTFVSAGIFELIGITPQDMIQDVNKFFVLLGDDQLAVFLKNTEESAKVGTMTHELRIASLKKWVQVQSKITQNDTQYIWNSVLTDITPLKSQQKELVEAKTKAIAATKAKSQFLANMSHEIRTPISGIISLLELFKEYDVPAEALKLHDSLTKSADNLLYIVNDILDFSKIEAGKLNIAPARTSLHSMFFRVVQTQSSHATSKNLRFDFWMAPEVEDQVIVDEVRLVQVMNNFTNNAIKFTESGSVRLAVDIYETTTNAQTLCITIADTGIGMDKECQENLFKAFVQGDESTQRRFGGTGLGLSISHQLITMMGGRVMVSSEPNKGSTFKILIPVVVVTPNVKTDLSRTSAVLVGEFHQRNEMESYLTMAGADVNKGDYGNKIKMSYDLLEQRADSLIISIAEYERLGLNKEWLDMELPDIKVLVVQDSPLFSPEPHDGNWKVSTSPLMPDQLYHCLINPVESVEDSDTTELENEAGKITRDEAIAQNRLILVAEDHPINRQVISTMLDQLNYAADIVEDGKQALDKIKNNSYGLLLTDCHMPEMDGYELTKAVRAREKSENLEPIPIIALTANAIHGEEDKCISMGMSAFLTKPVLKSKLRSVLEQWLPPLEPSREVDEDSLAAIDGFDFNFNENDTNADYEQSYKTNSEERRILDLNVVIDIFGDESFAKDIINQFANSYEQDVDELMAAVVQLDHDEIKNVSHRVKGAASTIGCTKVSEIASELEQLALTEAKDEYPSIMTYMVELKEDIRQAIRALEQS